MSALSGLLIGAHEMLVAATGEEIWRMAPEEADRLTRALENVGRHYSIRTNQKVVDWAALAMAAGSIYGTRAYAIAVKRRMQKANAPANGALHNPADIPATWFPDADALPQ